MIVGALMIALGLRALLKGSALIGLFRWLRSRARGAASDERGKARRSLVRLPVLKPWLGLIAVVSRRLISHLLVARGPLVEGATVLGVAVVEGAVLPRTPILLTLLVSGLALLTIRLLVRIGGHRRLGLPRRLGIELGLRSALLG